VNPALHWLGISELAAGYAAGKFKAAEVVEHMLARIAALDPGLRAYIEVDAVGARAAALESDRRFAAGDARPLEGITIAVKANIAVSGLAMSAGMEARRHMVADADAEAVARLRAAGAILIGTLNLHEAALGADNDNPWFGRAMNPHGQGRTPGGSSGGSGAAVAAGLCVAALGTDTLGSVRIPAAYCGVFGLKPSAGAVSQRGLELVAKRYDTIGPLARSLDDLDALFRVLVDAQPARPISHLVLLQDLGGVSCEPAVLTAYEMALAALREEGLPVAEHLELELMPIRFAGFVEAARELGEHLADLRAEAPDGFSPSLLFLLDYAAGRGEDELRESKQLLQRAREQIRGAIGEGVMLLPSAPQAAFLHGSRAPANQADFTALASISGLPALSIPAGRDEAGMPVAVQLVGAMGNELGLIQLARRLQPQLGGFSPPTEI
jgi:aspartyl-tRNA(Asn)/glutamyl-tRNA(Gln) amidotransferase subunit A